MKILQIGCGNMGLSLLSSVLDNSEFCSGKEVLIIDPGMEKAPKGATLLSGLDALEDESLDVVIIGLKPQQIDAIMPDYIPAMKDDCMVLSMAAGYSSEKLSTVFGGKPVVRMMPNMPVKIGMGVIGLVASDAVSEAQKQTVTDMFSLAGRTVWIDNDDMLDRFTAIAGSGPGYIYQFIEDYEKAATLIGFVPEEARMLVAETMLGSLALYKDGDASATELRKSITSKNGTTEAGLNEMQKDDLSAQMMKSVLESAYRRAREISEQ